MKDEIPVSVVEKDRKLSELSKQAAYDLDRHRWEQCSDPNGPQHRQDAYAAAVGVSQAVIARSVNTWAKAITAANPEVITRVITSEPAKRKGQGSRPSSETVEESKRIAATGQAKQPSREQHEHAKIGIRVGSEEAAVVDALTAAFKVTRGTAGDTSKQQWRDRREETMRRARTYVTDRGLTFEAACERAADELREERDIGRRLERRRKANEAEAADRTASFMEIVNIAVAGEKAMGRERQRVQALNLGPVTDPDEVSLLREEIRKAQAHLDWVTTTFLMVEAGI